MAEKQSRSLDSVCLTCPKKPAPETEPTRRPVDTAGLDQALSEYRSFADREYYNEAKDSAARQAYYGDIDWSAGGQALFEQFSTKVADTHAKVLDYRPAKYVYPWVDLQPDGQLRSIYSNIPMSPAKAIVEDWEVGQVRRQAENAMVFAQAAFSPEAAAVAFATQESSALNCEHVVPQSWFGKAQPQRGDLHHLFACESRCNSRRSNLPYDEFKMANDDWRDQCGVVGPERTFEPAGGKGAAARATLYFLLRYPGVVDSYDASDLQRMLDWNRRYPPDLWEKHRNAAIEELQGNRNPLIDFPSMASAIDFSQGLKGS
jgi:endonuclease I